MSHWRYGCVLRTYKTITDNGELIETKYELAEVYPGGVLNDDEGLGYTAEPIDIYSDSGKADLAYWLR